MSGITVTGGMTFAVNGGGGSGAYVKKIFTITSGNYGQTFNYSVGAAGAGGVTIF